MNLQAVSSLNRMRKTARALTVVEVMIAMGLGTLVLGAVMFMFMHSGRSMVAMGNYVSMDRFSCNAINEMTREIRQARALVAFSTNNPRFLTFEIPTGTGSYQVTYRWVGGSGSGALYREQGGVSKLLLTNVDVWTFKICQRTPVPGRPNEFYLATNVQGKLDPALCKLVDMTWKCSRPILGRKLNTETVQTAQIVLRNKGMTVTTTP